jgi:hypothetical protein
MKTEDESQAADKKEQPKQDQKKSKDKKPKALS